MTITSILPSPHKPGRFEVVVDDRLAATLSIDAIERLKLATGGALDEATAAAIQREAALLDTYDRALNMLAARPRSAAELRRLLVRKGEPADQVDAAIQRLTGAGFLDDASFARQFARSKALGAGLSRRRLQQELARRGVARATADDAVVDVFAEEGIDEQAAIERVAAKKLKTLARLDPQVQRRRLYAFLARRGYDSDDIARVVRTLAGAGN
ncbi:MAG TPA: regulatory protein RecX [Gemmatimonadaceae bacterium]|nr:regulatory protein RecX [Gemmatimonadaceae bacterium]